MEKAELLEQLDRDIKVALAALRSWRRLQSQRDEGDFTAIADAAADGWEAQVKHLQAMRAGALAGVS